MGKVEKVWCFPRRHGDHIVGDECYWQLGKQLRRWCRTRTWTHCISWALNVTMILDMIVYSTVQYSTVLAAISYININIILNVNEGNKGCGCGKADICIDSYENSSPFQYHLTWLWLTIDQTMLKCTCTSTVQYSAVQVQAWEILKVGSRSTLSTVTLITAHSVWYTYHNEDSSILVLGPTLCLYL